MTELLTTGHIVYRFYNSSNQLLYVGVTHWLDERMRQHQASKDWWPEVDQSLTTTERYLDRGMAMMVEAKAILTEAPRYNTAAPHGGRMPNQLTESDAHKLREVMRQWDETEATREELRQIVANMVGRSSFRAVAEVTGLSTNTLQRWKREAKS